MTSAVTLGDHVFKKENTEKNLSSFDVEITLGNSLKSVGDNPFAFCVIEPFAQKGNYEFNGTQYPTVSYTFDVSDTVKVIDGSLYCKVDSGYELITYGGMEEKGYVSIADDTVRISSYAFVGSDVVTVVLPHSLNAIGHKAFFDCDKLTTVIFRSYQAPVLEEQLDVAYYNSYDNIPGNGKYTLPLNNGETLVKDGLGIVDYYMWNVPSGMYYDVFFGANFMNHIGHIDRRITMVRPSNGQGYETFILDQYFEKTIDGSISATDETLAAIAAIAQLPRNIKLSHESLVVAARQAYDKITTRDQQALVADYSILVSAENKIAFLKGEGQPSTPNTPDSGDTPGSTPDSGDKPNDTDKPSTDSSTGEPSAEAGSSTGLVVIIIVLSTVIVAGGAFMEIYFVKAKKRK